jgi:hypothetical protein
VAVSRALCAFAIIFSLALAPAADGQTPPNGKTPPGQAKQPPAGSPDAIYALPQGNAYGFYCKGVSKKRVKGQKGTPFSQCVKAMKALDTGKAKTPAKACKALSKKKPPKVKGTNRRGKSPYAKCVSGARKLLKDKKPA